MVDRGDRGIGSMPLGIGSEAGTRGAPQQRAGGGDERHRPGTGEALEPTSAALAERRRHVVTGERCQKQCARRLQHLDEDDRAEPAITPIAVPARPTSERRTRSDPAAAAGVSFHASRRGSPQGCHASLQVPARRPLLLGDLAGGRVRGRNTRTRRRCSTCVIPRSAGDLCAPALGHAVDQLPSCWRVREPRHGGDADPHADGSASCERADHTPRRGRRVTPSSSASPARLCGPREASTTSDRYWVR